MHCGHYGGKRKHPQTDIPTDTPTDNESPVDETYISTATDENSKECIIVAKRVRIDLLDSKLQKIKDSFCPQKALIISEFQKLLVDKKTSEAIVYLQKVKHENIDFTNNYLPSSFRSYVVEVLSSTPPEKDCQILITMLHKAGLLTRKELSRPYRTSTGTWTAQHLAIDKTSPFFFNQLNKLLDSSVIDWQAVEPTNGDTPLTITLSVNAFNDSITHFTDEKRHVYDTRAVELINILPDSALNTPNKMGRTPLILAISESRVLSLKALISRLPAVDFYPELRLKPDGLGKQLESVNVALDSLSDKYNTSCAFKHHWPAIRTLVETGRVLVKQYSQKMLEMTSLLMDHHFGIMTTDITKIIFGYSRPDPADPKEDKPS